MTERRTHGRFIDTIDLLNQGARRVEALWVGDGDLLEQCIAGRETGAAWRV